MTPSFRMHHTLHPKALNLSPDRFLLLLLTHLLPLRPTIRKPDQAGKPRGVTWTLPVGTFRIIPLDGSRKGWRRCNINTLDWSTLLGEPTTPWTTVGPETSSGRLRRGRTRKSWTKRGGNLTRSGTRTLSYMPR